MKVWLAVSKATDASLERVVNRMPLVTWRNHTKYTLTKGLQALTWVSETEDNILGHIGTMRPSSMKFVRTRSFENLDKHSRLAFSAGGDLLWKRNLQRFNRCNRTTANTNNSNQIKKSTLSWKFSISTGGFTATPRPSYYSNFRTKFQRYNLKLYVLDAVPRHPRREYFFNAMKNCILRRGLT